MHPVYTIDRKAGIYPLYACQLRPMDDPIWIDQLIETLERIIYKEIREISIPMHYGKNPYAFSISKKHITQRMKCVSRNGKMHIRLHQHVA